MKKKSEPFENLLKKFFWYYLVRDKVSFLKKKLKKRLKKYHFFWYYLVKDIDLQPAY